MNPSSSPRSTWLRTLALALPLVGCATSGSKTEQLSAREHEEAAAQHKAEARQAANRFDGKAVRYTDIYPEPRYSCDQTLPGQCSPIWTMTKNPTQHELSEASAHLWRARAHRKAAQRLREAEATACKDVALQDQDMSPFNRRSDILLVEELGRSDGRSALAGRAGAAVLFTAVPGLTVASMQRIVDCQVARNAALGFDQSDTAYCPLNVRGAQATARPDPRGIIVEVTSADPGAAIEIVRRAQALSPPGAPVASAR
jgi:hypothetical protein